MGQHTSHEEHTHGTGCGHTAIRHEGHVDYLHDGHLCHAEGDKMEEHTIPVGERNADACTPAHRCGGHDVKHAHGPACEHARVPHGDHVDYLVNGHLHHPHDGHCDDHGPIQVQSVQAVR